MPMPTQAGRYLAQVTEAVVNETGQNKLTTVILKFAILSEEQGGQMVDVSARGMHITDYIYVEKRDGSLNQFAVDRLREVFGWPGDDVFWFEQQAELPNAILVLEEEEYQGQSRMRVKYINGVNEAPSGSTPPVDAATKRAIQARIGPKLRANAGGTPVTPPVKAPGAHPNADIPF